jgi:hypothetical protein
MTYDTYLLSSEVEPLYQALYECVLCGFNRYFSIE